VKVLGFAGQADVARNVSPAQASPIGIEPAAPKRWLFIRSSGEYLLIKDFCYRVKRKIDLVGMDTHHLAGKDLTDQEKYLAEGHDSRSTRCSWEAGRPSR
jgi:hypothetical protein